MKNKVNILLIYNDLTTPYIFLCDNLVNAIKNHKQKPKFKIVKFQEILETKNYDEILKGIDIVISNYHIPEFREYVDKKNILQIPNTQYFNICGDKNKLNNKLVENKIPTPLTIPLNNSEYSVLFKILSKQLKVPFVLKYNHGWGGYKLH